MENKSERDEQFDSQYIGNVWGWKFSVFGAVLIVTLLLAMWYRHYSTQTAPGFDRQEMPIDKVFDNS